MHESAESTQSDALARFLARDFAPSTSGEILAIRPYSTRALRIFPRASVRCLQTNRMLADALESAGFQASTDVTGHFDLCLVEATKHKDENLFHVAWAWSLLRPGGHLLVSAANTLGGESLAKRIAQAGLPIRSTHSYAKCRVVWLQRDETNSEIEAPPGWLDLDSFRTVPGTQLVTRAGVFSAGGIDPGTQLLIESLVTPLRGSGADFGAGYGALAHHVLSTSDAITRFDLYEIEYKALAAARRNLAPWQGRVDLRFEWADVQRVESARAYDWIVMNPPFHAGRLAIPPLGKAFIRSAAANLSVDGVVWLVANRRLPYEGVLEECFADIETLTERSGFKILRARKPHVTRLPRPASP
jgi:16S rRNA (guanine1207-N2)-methyltransferase